MKRVLLIEDSDQFPFQLHSWGEQFEEKQLGCIDAYGVIGGIKQFDRYYPDPGVHAIVLDGFAGGSYSLLGLLQHFPDRGFSGPIIVTCPFLEELVGQNRNLHCVERDEVVVRVVKLLESNEPAYLASSQH